MPVDFLTEAEVAAYGRFTGPPSRTQLERCFLPGDADRRRIKQRRGDHNRLGFALQLGTVRFLGTFLAQPTEVPAVLVEYVAGQLGIAEPCCLSRYAMREPTHREHAGEIQRAYGYRNFAAAADEVRAFLAARAWVSNDGPHVLFDRATGWLRTHKVLLPGATILAKLVAVVRAEATKQVWRVLTDAINALDGATRLVSGGTRVRQVRRRLDELLEVEEGARVSQLERSRTAPSGLSGPALRRAGARPGGARDWRWRRGHLSRLHGDSTDPPRRARPVRRDG